MGGGVDPAEVRDVAPPVGLVEEVGDRRRRAGRATSSGSRKWSSTSRNARIARASAEYERRTRGLVVAVAAVEPEAQVGRQPLDGVAQLVGTEQLVLHDPAGEHAVADVVAQVRIVLAEQVEERREQLAGGEPGRHLGVRVDDRFPQPAVRCDAHHRPVLHPARRGRIPHRRSSLAHWRDASPPPADPLEGGRARHRAPGQRRRGRAGDGLGVQQRDGRHADAGRVRRHRRQRGPGVPRALRPAAATTTTAARSSRSAAASAA